jgi:hypothetical protein
LSIFYFRFSIFHLPVAIFQYKLLFIDIILEKILFFINQQQDIKIYQTNIKIKILIKIIKKIIRDFINAI